MRRTVFSYHEILVLLCFTIFVSVVWFQPAAYAQVKKMATLNDLLDLAVERNLRLKVARLSLEQAVLSKTLPSTEFDPSWSSELSATGTSQSTGVVYLPSKRSGRNFSLNYRRPSWDGNRYDFSISVSRTQSNSAFAALNPSIEADMTMGFRRPLEEDRGLISLKLPIRRAENRMQVVESAFKQELEGLLLQVENTYWDLVLAKNLLLVRKQSYDLAEELRELTRNQVDVGVQPPIALTQAKAGVAARAEAVIVSEGLIHDLEEALITYIDMPLHDRSILKDLELELPEMEKIKLAPVETLVESAVDRRPEILSARQAVEIQKIEKQLVADRRKQQVDLIGSLRNPGTAGDISSATDQVMDKHFYSWMLGISWELGKRRKEDLDYSIAEIELIKTMLTLESTMEMVTAQIRGAYRQVDIALKRIESTTSARVLAEEQLEAERERFKLGLATPYDLLLVENDLSNARSSEVSALVDLQKSLASLAFSRGVLAESWEVDY